MDERILEILESDARVPFVELGKKLGLSEGAVRRRVKRLVETGVIKRFTIERGAAQGVRALSFLTIDPGTPTPRVAERLAYISGIQAIYELTGEYDAVALISSPSVEDLNRCIEEIRGVEGVRDTNTAIILRFLGPSRL